MASPLLMRTHPKVGATLAGCIMARWWDRSMRPRKARIPRASNVKPHAANWRAAVDACKRVFGGLDVLVNNARCFWQRRFAVLHRR